MITEQSPANSGAVFSELEIVKQSFYEKCALTLTNFKQRPESAEYGACTFKLNGLTVEHRISKTTPTKTGQFVAIWKRNERGKTEPFNLSDDFDFIAITSGRGEDLGQFVFPKSVLADKGIIAQNGKEGKRGIRVYPPWDITTNRQAQNTQGWQTKYFIVIKDDNVIDFNLVRNLFDKT